MRVAEALASTLVELGVRQIFGVVGSGNYEVTEALQRASATFTPARHEGGAVTMTDAYGRTTGEIAACSVHQGPGLTNAVTGLAEAAKSRTPLLVLAAESGGPRSNFRIDQAALATSVGAIAERARSPETAVADAVRAYQRAQLERRPVVLNLPLEVLGAETEPPAIPARPELRPAVPAPEAITAAVDLLRRARRPLILAGRGAVLGGAGPALEELGDRIGAVLTTSAVANGLFSESPWSIGIAGGFASTLASELIAESDVVLAVGASLNMWTTRHGRLLGPDVRVIEVDIDPGEI
ncbi:MAG: thiamine pyrophosphate-binding protein, partial [Candidatus Dormibacteraceae bacterium]